MPKITGAILCATLALGLPVAALAQATDAENPPATQASELSADTVLAKVGEIEITLGHLIAAVGDLEQEESQLPNDVLLNGLTDRLIQQAAIAEAAGDVSQAARLRLDNERRALIAGEAIGARAVAIDVSAEDVQAAYDERFADFTPDQEFNAAHILVETEDEAKTLVAELEGGADFAELAREKSTGPSGPNGGNLGWFARGQMVEPFQDAVEKLAAGEISGPVETRFGWHVIKLMETRIPEVPTLDQMTGELRRMVFNTKLRAEIENLIDTVEIDRMDLDGIDPDVVRDVSLIGR